MPVDKVASTLAANAYSNTQKTGVGSGISAAGQGPSFGELVKKAAEDSIQTMRTGEKVSAEAVMGNATLTDVVEAVTAAEMTLQTVVSVRDRMLSAYQEIMRMPM